MLEILRRTLVCGVVDFDRKVRQRTRPKELKFQLWSRLREKCQKRTVVCGMVCGCGVVCGFFGL